VAGAFGGAGLALDLLAHQRVDDGLQPLARAGSATPARACGAVQRAVGADHRAEGGGDGRQGRPPAAVSGARWRVGVGGAALGQQGGHGALAAADAAGQAQVQGLAPAFMALQAQPNHAQDARGPEDHAVRPAAPERAEGHHAAFAQRAHLHGDADHAPMTEAIRMMGTSACQPNQAPRAANSLKSP
jgi:hypothetical protein